MHQDGQNVPRPARTRAMLRVMAAVDRAEIDIAAPPARVWDLVTDLYRMGDWSPECYRCAWMDGGTGPRVGARFKGWNRQDLGPIPVRWTMQARCAPP